MTNAIEGDLVARGALLEALARGLDSSGDVSKVVIPGIIDDIEGFLDTYKPASLDNFTPEEEASLLSLGREFLDGSELINTYGMTVGAWIVHIMMVNASQLSETQENVRQWVARNTDGLGLNNFEEAIK